MKRENESVVWPVEMRNGAVKNEWEKGCRQMKDEVAEGGMETKEKDSFEESEVQRKGMKRVVRRKHRE